MELLGYWWRDGLEEENKKNEQLAYVFRGRFHNPPGLDEDIKAGHRRLKDACMMMGLLPKHVRQWNEYIVG